MNDGEEFVRIGELGRRVGVGPDTLRAWERRYGLLQPTRTQGGFRLYSQHDERRVRAMQAHLERGLSAAQAAHAVLASLPAGTPSTLLDDLRARLAVALAEFDDPVAHAVLDRMFAAHGTDVVLRDAVYPYLRDLGEAWERAEIDVGQEHYASNLLESRILGLSPGWERGRGPRAVLACAPGEQHSLPLAGLGITLRDRGWRVTYLGADTPIAMTARTAATLAPRLVVISSTMAHLLRHDDHDLRSLAGSVRLVLAGAGASAKLAERFGAEYIDSDPVTAAQRLTDEDDV